MVYHAIVVQHLVARHVAVNEYLDITSIIGPPPAMVAQLRAGADCFAADGMHPNDKGYALWAEVIAQRLLREWEHPGREGSHERT